MLMKNSSDSIRNQTRDLRLLAQCLIALLHRVLPQLVKGRHYEDFLILSLLSLKKVLFL